MNRYAYPFLALLVLAGLVGAFLNLWPPALLGAGALVSALVLFMEEETTRRYGNYSLQALTNRVTQLESASGLDPVNEELDELKKEITTIKTRLGFQSGGLNGR